MSSSLLGQRVRWRASGRMLEGVVIYDGRPWQSGEWQSDREAWSPATHSKAITASQRAWGHRRPASRSGIVVRADLVRCEECGGEGRDRSPSQGYGGWECGVCRGAGWQPKTGRVYYAPLRRALEVIE